MSKWMFRYLSAFVMLMLYIAVSITSDVVTLTCECRYHKHDSHATAHSSHNCKSGCCGHSSKGCHDVNKLTFGSACECNHNHSTEVALYTQPRFDDGLVRQTILLAVLTDVVDTLEVPTVITSCDNSEYRLPALLSGYVGNCALRAPPVLV